MKKALSHLLEIIAVFALILAGAETEDGGICLWWTLGCLAVLLLAVKGWEKLNPKENK